MVRHFTRGALFLRSLFATRANSIGARTLINFLRRRADVSISHHRSRGANVHVFATEEDSGVSMAQIHLQRRRKYGWRIRGDRAAIHEGKKAVLNVNKGFKTRTDGRFFAYYSSASEPFDNDGKDLVVQYSVKHEQNIDRARR